jgi:predicted nucleic acid-binding protein
MAQLLIDTDVLIDYLRERPESVTYLEKLVRAVDEAIAARAGILRRDFGKSHGTGLADAIIAATAEERQAQLVTLNKKHFPMLNDVIVPYTKV